MAVITEARLVGDWRRIVGDHVVSFENGGGLDDVGVTGTVTLTPNFGKGPQGVLADNASLYTAHEIKCRVMWGRLHDADLNNPWQDLIVAVDGKPIVWTAAFSLTYKWRSDVQAQKIALPQVTFDVNAITAGQISLTSLIPSAQIPSNYQPYLVSAQASAQVASDAKTVAELSALAADQAKADATLAKTAAETAKTAAETAATLATTEADRAVGLATAQDQAVADTVLAGGPTTTALNATYGTKAEVAGKIDSEVAVERFVPARVSDQAEAFNLPRPTLDAVNPPSVVGVDPVTGIVYAAHRGSSSLAMSGDQGSSWSTGKAFPAGVNHVQVHKIVRFGAHVYLHAISGVDGRAGVYRSPAPATASDPLRWDDCDNKVTNSSFETDVAGWVGYPASDVTVSRNASGGFAGTSHARVALNVIGSVTASAGIALNGTGETIPVTEGQQFAYSAYIKAPSARRVLARISWTGVPTPGRGTTHTTTGQWQRVTLVGTVPTGATGLRPDIEMAPVNLAVGDTLDVDGVMVELGTTTVRNYTPKGSAYRYTLMPLSASSGTHFEALNGKSTCFNASGTTVMLADYGHNFAGGPSIQRSLDGVAWQKVWQAPQSRHLHAVAPDPFHPGHWWATVGDGATNDVGLIRTPDDGDTWEIIQGGLGNKYQSVQISFSEKYVYLAADHYGSSAFYLSRDEKVIRNLNFGGHVNVSVPGGLPSRVIQVTTTAGSTAITSPDLLASDRGRRIWCDNVPLIAGVSNAGEPNWLPNAADGSATLRKAATATGTATAIIGGDQFFTAAYMGAVDPNTDVYYFAAMDTSSVGNTFGILCIPHRGASPIALDMSGQVRLPPTAWRNLDEVFIHDGMVYSGTRRFPAINV